MPLIGTKGAASSQGFGFFRLSSNSGYYYSIPTLTAYSQPLFTGVQPISTGWIVSGYRSTDYFNVTLGPTGALLSYKQDSLNYFSSVSSMHRGGASAFSTDAVPVYFGNGIDKFGFIDNSPSYTGTPGNIANGLINYSILGIDYSANRFFSTATYNDGTYDYAYIASSNYSAGTTNWVRRWNVASPWKYPTVALIRNGDSTNVLVAAQYNSTFGAIKFNKSTAAVSSAYAFSSTALGVHPLSFISDPSGNLYFGTQNGQIIRVNTSDTVDWAYEYSDSSSGQNFGYTYVCYYDGYLYAIGTSHSNGNYLTKINPANGSVVWATKITGALYNCYGISASANGIMVVGENLASGGYSTAYLLNYPLAGGFTGVNGDFTFTNMTVNLSSVTTTFDSVSGPTTSVVTAGSTSTYTSSLNTATSILGTQTNF